MAECALAVSFAPVGGGMKIDYIDGELLSGTGEALPLEEGAPTRRKGFINCGKPLPGFEVDIRDDEGRVLPERQVGRVFPAQSQRHGGLLQFAGHHGRSAVR